MHNVSKFWIMLTCFIIICCIFVNLTILYKHNKIEEDNQMANHGKRLESGKKVGT